MKKILFILLMVMTLIVPVFTADAASPSPESSKSQYVTKQELAEAIAKAVGEKPGKYSEYTFSEGPENNATMADVVEILFQSGMMKKEVNKEKVFLGQPITRVYK